MSDNKQNIKITVITVCFNAAATIERTIRSVLWQDYANIEYVIVDGMSTDGTMDIIDKYRDDISLIIREPDEGVYDAMNKGVQRSNGHVINFMNADDCFAAPDVISIVARAFRQHPDIVIICGDSVMSKEKQQSLQKHPDIIHWRLFRKSFLNHQALFLHRRAFSIVGLFDTAYKIYADYDWNIRALHVHNLPYLHIPLTVCVFKSGGISGGVLHIQGAEKRAALLRLKSSERQIIHRKYFSFGERLYFTLVNFVEKFLKRLVHMDFRIPIGLRTSWELRKHIIKKCTDITR